MRRPPRDDYLNVKSNWEEIVIESLMRNAGNLVSRASIRKPLRRRVGKFEFAFAGMNAETFRFKHAETRQPNVLTFFFLLPISVSITPVFVRGKNDEQSSSSST